MENMMNEIIRSIGAYLPSLIGALAILILGWVLAMIIASVIRRVLRRLGFNHLMRRWTGAEEKEGMPDLENGIAKVTYYFLMLFVLIAFFQALRITMITEPLTNLLNEVFLFVPQIVGAALLLLTAWVVAKILQIVVFKGLTAAKIDQRVGRRLATAEAKSPALAKSIADAVYFLVFLLFLPAILGALALDGLLAPVMSMINRILDFVPNLATAAIIMVVGWFAARLVQQIVTNLLTAIGTDQLSERVGLAPILGRQTLSGVIGFIIYAFMIIPVAIAALNTLQLESITAPASNMLNMILAALPNIFAATAVIVISYIIGRLAGSLTSTVLAGVGFDALLGRLGLFKETTAEKWPPSKIAGTLVFLGIIFFAVLEGARLLDFTALADLIFQFMLLAGHILLGLIIFAVGLAIADFAGRAIRTSTAPYAGLYATAARIVILVFAGAMALRQMGLANEIINLAFGLVLGALALALAIAFGLGARDIAGRELDQWLQSIRTKPGNPVR